MTEPLPKPGDGQPIVFFDLTLGGQSFPHISIDISYLFSTLMHLSLAVWIKEKHKSICTLNTFHLQPQYLQLKYTMASLRPPHSTSREHWNNLRPPSLFNHYRFPYHPTSPVHQPPSPYPQSKHEQNSTNQPTKPIQANPSVA